MPLPKRNNHASCSSSSILTSRVFIGMCAIIAIGAFGTFVIDHNLELRLSDIRSLAVHKIFSSSSATLQLVDDNNNVKNDDSDSKSRSRISFRLLSAIPGEGPLRNASMGMMYRCKIILSNDTTQTGFPRTSTLPSALQGRGVLDFATKITTDLNTLFVGDSVGQQISEAMDESFGMSMSWTTFDKSMDNENMTRRKLLWGAGGWKEILSISSLLRGGGSSAYWRMTDLWSTQNKQKGLPPSPGGGWNDNQANMLLDAMPDQRANNRTSFDAVVLNYNNWIKPINHGNVTQERYENSIRLAKSVVGAKAVILVTWPFTRLVESEAAWEAVNDANHMIRQVAANSRIDQSESESGGALALVLEFGELTNQLLWTNARHLGYNVSDPQQVSLEDGWERKDNVTQLLGPRIIWGWRVPMICAQMTPNTKRSPCILNQLSCDDMHWCTETIGARFAAGVACLLGCAFNSCSTTSAAAGTSTGSSIDLCEKDCNNRFMTINPIEEKWIETDLLIQACPA